jgi:hypothetical protein
MFVYFALSMKNKAKVRIRLHNIHDEGGELERMGGVTLARKEYHLGLILGE